MDGPPPLLEDHGGENPYAPPQSVSALPAVSGLPFTVYEVFLWSWSIFGRRMRTCLSIFWGMCGISLLFSLIASALLKALEAGVTDEYLYKILYITVMFLGNVFQFWLAIGIAIAFLKISRDEDVTVEDLTSGGGSLLTVILAWIVHKVLLAVPIAVAVGVIVGGIVLMENQSGVAAVLLFLVVSGVAGIVFIILAARMSLYYYLVVDQGAGVFGSLAESWRLCRNQVGTITLVYCVQFAVALAGFLAFCVGLIFALPLVSLIDVVLYLAIVTGATSGGRTPPFFVKKDA